MPRSSIKTSVSLTSDQDRYIREQVERGHYASVSAVVQHGIEELRQRKRIERQQNDHLIALFERRERRPFVDVEEDDPLIDRLFDPSQTDLETL